MLSAWVAPKERIFIRASYQAGFDTRSFLWWGFREKGGHTRVDSRTLWVIGSLGASQPLQNLPALMPGDLADHRFSRLEGLLQCESMLVIPPNWYKCQATIGKPREWVKRIFDETIFGLASHEPRFIRGVPL